LEEFPKGSVELLRARTGVLKSQRLAERSAELVAGNRVFPMEMDGVCLPKLGNVPNRHPFLKPEPQQFNPPQGPLTLSSCGSGLQSRCLGEHKVSPSAVESLGAACLLISLVGQKGCFRLPLGLTTQSNVPQHAVKKPPKPLGPLTRNSI
jgi:hypothetical protein